MICRRQRRRRLFFSRVNRFVRILCPAMLSQPSHSFVVSTGGGRNGGRIVHRQFEFTTVLPCTVPNSSIRLWILARTSRLSPYELRVGPRKHTSAGCALRGRTATSWQVDGSHPRRGPQWNCVGKSFQGCPAPPLCSALNPNSTELQGRFPTSTGGAARVKWGSGSNPLLVG
jgi:hypothetical protein